MKTPGLVFYLLLVVTTGCQYQHCKSDASYADKPGICGKIYRQEQAKKRLANARRLTIYVFVGMIVVPFCFVLVFRLIRLLLRSVYFLYKMLYHRE